MPMRLISMVLSLLSPSFADDISLLALHPSFARVLMQMFKSGVVTFGETRAVHCDSMKRHE